MRAIESLERQDLQLPSKHDKTHSLKLPKVLQIGTPNSLTPEFMQVQEKAGSLPAAPPPPPAMTQPATPAAQAAEQVRQNLFTVLDTVQRTWRGKVMPVEADVALGKTGAYEDAQKMLSDAQSTFYAHCKALELPQYAPLDAAKREIIALINASGGNVDRDKVEMKKIFRTKILRATGKADHEIPALDGDWTVESTEVFIAAIKCNLKWSSKGYYYPEHLSDTMKRCKFTDDHLANIKILGAELEKSKVTCAALNTLGKAKIEFAETERLIELQRERVKARIDNPHDQDAQIVLLRKLNGEYTLAVANALTECNSKLKSLGVPPVTEGDVEARYKPKQ